MSKEGLRQLETELQVDFKTLRDTFDRIHTKLQAHADKKLLKGNEVVGWLGQIYGKILLKGTLVDDKQEHYFMTEDGKRVSVKTRRGKSWKESSAIPEIEGDDCPTHLMFVRLHDDYRAHAIWLYDWKALLQAGRFRDHVVRGTRRSYIFLADEELDRAQLIYSSEVNE